MKDDFKLLGQVKNNNIAYVITEDSRTLYKYCEKLREQKKLQAHAIKLTDGFDKSNFALDGQRNFVLGDG